MNLIEVLGDLNFQPTALKITICLIEIIGWPRKAAEELLEICQFRGKGFGRKKKRDLLADSKA
jgi:hypothetical protein